MGAPSTRSGLLQRAHVIAGEFRYVGKETDRKWEEGDDISILEFKTTEYGRARRVVASEEVKRDIRNIGINKCARESGFDRKNFVRKLDRGLPVKRNSYDEFVRWLQSYKSRMVWEPEGIFLIMPSNSLNITFSLNFETPFQLL